MEIGIVTHYDVHNHGALLQLNALIKVLKSFGYEAKALKFEKNYDFLGVERKYKYEIGLKSIPVYLKYLLSRGCLNTLYNIRKKKCLNEFKRSESLIGEYYTTYSSLTAIIIGSDEVFALHTGPTPVFWGYALPSQNIFSYGASFGPSTFTDIKKRHCVSFVKSGLENMNALSVRDMNSFNIIFSLINKKAQLVCDPVLLYGYKSELNAIQKKEKYPYLIVYSYDMNMNSNEEVKEIRAYAKKHNLTIISAGFYHKWCDKNINVDPISLLAYFRDATCAVTDTFHGSVLSILNNTELAVRVRSNSNKLQNLLEEYKLSDRILRENDCLEDKFNIKINWEQVNEELEKRRALSWNYLNKCLKHEH